MNFAENLARSITAPVTNTLAAGIIGKSEFVILDQSSHVMARYNAPKTGEFIFLRYLRMENQ